MSAAAGGAAGEAALAQPPAGLGSEGGDAAPPLAGAPNPFEGVQRPGRERTLKYALWEVLARHYPGGAHASELERDERLFELRPSLRERKNPSGQIAGELKDDHFYKVGDLWMARPARKGGNASGGGSAGSGGHKAGGAAAPRPPPPVPPGNESSGRPWAGASCRFLADKLRRLPVSVWWAGEQRFFEGKIMYTIEEGSLLVLQVQYEDGTDEWMQPTQFKVTGERASPLVVVREYAVYIWSEEAGRYVPDPDQGEDRTAAAATADGATAGVDAATAAAAAAMAGGAAGAAAAAQQQHAAAGRREQRERQPARQPQERERAAADGREQQGERKRRREAEAEAEAEAQRRRQQRKQQTAADAGGKEPAAGARPFSIPKRPAVEQAAGAAEDDSGSRAKPPAGDKPAFRIPKAAAAAPAPAAPPPPDRERQREREQLREREHPGSSKRPRPEEPRRASELRPQPAPPRTQPVLQPQPAPRAHSPPRDPQPGTCQQILRVCDSAVVRALSGVRWSVPAKEAQLPAPPADPAAAEAAAAAAAPHRAALAARLAACGPWPHGSRLLPAAPATAEQLPDSFRFGRIFISKRETVGACLERGLFVSNSPLDMDGLRPGMLALMHSLDERLVYGCFQVLECGVNLDPSFPAPGFHHHVRVAPLRLFQPVPAELLDAFCERKVHPRSGERMKFFDRHLSQKQCRQVWALLAHYEGKLCTEYDCPCGWQRSLAPKVGA